MKIYLSGVILLCVLKISLVISQNNAILCKADDCLNVKCDALPIKCQIQNETHTGLFLPSPETCNCCPFCLEILFEGEKCNSGSPSSLSPTTAICGSGLSCIDSVCKPMDSTPCTREQIDYDTRREKGELGYMEVRANCDHRGDYQSYKCIPGQNCYCVDKFGKRIFGQIDYADFAEFNLNCECSRKYEDAVRLLGRQLLPYEHFRCKANGDYDNIQCIADSCLCTDSYDGAPTYPDESSVKLVNITKLKCFDENIYNSDFYSDCEWQYINSYNEDQAYIKEGFDVVIATNYPKCDIDGTYAPVQENFTHKYCVDTAGVVDERYVIDKSSEDAQKMTCKCYRANLVTSNIEKLSCDNLGNYNEMQCRRGTCRSVDENGNQIGLETD